MDIIDNLPMEAEDAFGFYVVIDLEGCEPHGIGHPSGFADRLDFPDKKIPDRQSGSERRSHRSRFSK